MNKFLVFACALACVSADIGLKIRQGQYGTPTGSYLPGVGSNSFNSFNAAPGVGGYSDQHAYSQGGAPQGFVGQQGFNGFVQQNFAGIPQAIQQHRAYFFDAPEDLGATHVRVHVQPSAAAGDKSIFIKAPSYSSKIIPHFNIPQQQQAGRTKVVVLVKKPEEVQDIVIPAAVQGPASKPEVTFVTYKTQKEAESKIQDIQQGATGGSSAKTVFNHRELVANIKDEPSFDGSSLHSIVGGGPIVGGGSIIGGGPIIGGGGIIGGSSGSGILGDAPAHFDIGTGGSSSADHHHETTNYGPAGASGPY